MNAKKYLLGALIALLMTTPSLAGDTKDVMKTLDAEGWKLMVHLRAIPEQYREMLNATHHIAITVTDDKGKHVSNAKVTFEFLRKGKVVAKGEAKYMGGGGHGSGSKVKTEGTCGGCGSGCGGHSVSPMAGSGSKGKHAQGHNGADFTLPGSGEYTLKITVTIGKVVKKASTKITAP